MHVLTFKIFTAILSVYLYNIIINSEYLQVPDNNYELVKCTPVPGGYEYKNTVINIENLEDNSPIECWHGCYANTGCKIFLKQPGIYGYTTRFLMAIITIINIYVFTQIS